jgi:uncharacterized protein
MVTDIADDTIGGLNLSLLEYPMSTFDSQSILSSPEYREELAAQRTFMARVYSWMTIALLATALTSLTVVLNPPLSHLLFGTGAIWVLLIAELGIGLAFPFIYRAIPSPVAAGLFITYAVLLGAVLSPILLAYTASSVAGTFFITAGMFAGVSAYGYITHRSLNSLGSFCMMGLFGMLLAIVVNFFVASSAMDWLISFVGVIVFTGLTAYHTQKIKEGYADSAAGTSAYNKSALMSAFALYLDFINLFLYLLRFLGNRRS